MFRQDARLGAIAQAAPDYKHLPVARSAAPERAIDWPDLQMRLRLLLVDPKGEDWVARLRTVRDEILAQVARHPDHALLRLMYDATTEFQDYSANHALFVAVLCSLASAQLPGWNPEWDDALTMASLTMNVSITSLQDEMARQPVLPTVHQRSSLLGHGERSAALLGTLGVDDPVWLHAVTHHHDAPPGKIIGRPPEETIARLIRRADRYAARLSPRKSRRRPSRPPRRRPPASTKAAITTRLARRWSRRWACIRRAYG